MTFSVNDSGHDVPETGCYVVVDGADYVGVVSADSVAHAPKKQVFLVDHNEKKQIIDGIDEAQIVGRHLSYGRTDFHPFPSCRLHSYHGYVFI